MNAALGELSWGSVDRRPFVVFERVGGEAMFFRAFAWIDDRTTEPYYGGLLLTALVDALENAGLSVGQTTNLSVDPQALFQSNDEISRLLPEPPRSSRW